MPRSDADLYDPVVCPDTAQDRVLLAGPGSRVDVPERVLHSEESYGYQIIAGMSVNPAKLTEPVDRDPDSL